MADPLLGSVVALLNFVDGAIVDSSPVGGTYTAVNGAAIVTGAPDVLRLDGSDDYVSGPSGSNFEFPGEFCIEVWAVKSAAGAGNYDTALTTDTSNASASNGWIFELGSARGFSFVANGGALLRSAATTINDGALHHWCVRRGADGVVRLDKDGAQLTSLNYTSTISSAGSLGVGRNAALTAYPFKGDILAVRITRSGRYAGTSYTPDTAPFSAVSPALSGNIKDAAGANAARLVVAYLESTKALVGSTTSNAATGAYSIPATSGGAHTLIAYPAAGENLPALTLRGVIPA